MTEPRPIIEVTDLVKAFGIIPVLRKFNFHVRRGEFVALLGPNGSGKSTLLRLLAGLSKPTAGSIRIGGWELPREAAAVRGQIGMVSHKPLLYDNLTARENLLFFARLYNIPVTEQKRRIQEQLKRVGLDKRADDLVRTFSRGMLQRLTIARALLHRPHVLLLDEPYTGLDQDAGSVLDELLIEAHHTGHTLVMATHQLERAARLTQRTVILSRGKLALNITTENLSGHELAARYSEVTGAQTAS